MNHSRALLKSLAATAFCTTCAPLVHGAVGIPYFDDFSSYGVGASNNSSANTATAFIESNDAAFAAYTLTGGNSATNFFRANIQSSSNASAVVESSVPGGNNFTVSTIVRPTALTVGTPAPTTPAMIFSLVAASGLSTTANGSGGYDLATGNYRLTIDYLGGGIVMQKVVGSTVTSIGTASGASASTWFNNISSPYLTFTLTGSYTSATSVDLVGTVSDGTNTYTINATDGTDALTGSYFGYRVQKVSGTSGPQFTTRMDNFSLDVVPEPSSALLAAAGMGVFISRRRR